MFFQPKLARFSLPVPNRNRGASSLRRSGRWSTRFRCEQRTAARKVAIIPDADRLQTEAANAFLKTLEEPPKDSLLLLLSALPEALPETILSRCISIPLASDGEPQSKKEQEKLVKLLQQASRQTTWSIQFAYRLAQEFQQLLRAIREEVKHETDEALKREQTRYKDATDGAWLEEREEYYKALTESLYLQRRAALVETLFAWWTDVLRANNAVAQRDIPAAKQETAALASRFSTAEILRADPFTRRIARSPRPKHPRRPRN